MFADEEPDYDGMVRVEVYPPPMSLQAIKEDAVVVEPSGLEVRVLLVRETEDGSGPDDDEAERDYDDDEPCGREDCGPCKARSAKDVALCEKQEVDCSDDEDYGVEKEKERQEDDCSDDEDYGVEKEKEMEEGEGDGGWYGYEENATQW